MLVSVQGSLQCEMGEGSKGEVVFIVGGGKYSLLEVSAPTPSKRERERGAKDCCEPSKLV